MPRRPLKQPAEASAHPFLRNLLCAAFAGVFAVAIGMGAADAQSGRNITKQIQNQTSVALPSLSPLVERVMPAVVNISARLGPQAAAQVEEQEGSSAGPEGTPFDELLRRFFEQEGLPPLGRPQPPPQRVVTALGSGFIIDPDGYVVTNNHVVAKAQTVTVIFQDNSRHPAKVVGRDPLTDLALLKIDTSQPLPYVQWGDSDKAKVGDWVVAVGNPFGLGGTVTAGIVSARGRNISAADYEDFLQVDAPINRGNSGGPTFNLAGQVIGINTAIYSPSGGSVGIGFAIPSDVAKNVIDQIKTTGHAEHGWLGVSIQNVTPDIAQSFGLDPNKAAGALVASVMPNSPAAEAGLKQGDIILGANGQPVHTAHDLRRIVGESRVGEKLELTVRRSGQEQKLAATVGKLPVNEEVASTQPPGDKAQPSPSGATALGLKLAPLTPDLRARLDVPQKAEGVVVAAIAANSPAAALGLEPGDVIMSVDQQPVKSPEEAAQKLQAAAAKGQVLLLLSRDGTPQFLALSVENGQGNASGSSNPG
jgi:serine protease Do